jgi:hypothetical protein
MIDPAVNCKKYNFSTKINEFDIQMTVKLNHQSIETF